MKLGFAITASAAKPTSSSSVCKGLAVVEREEARTELVTAAKFDRSHDVPSANRVYTVEQVSLLRSQMPEPEALS